MQYKKIIVSFIFIVICLQLFGQPVSKELAETVAKNYYKIYAPQELNVLKEKHKSAGQLKKSKNFYKADATIKETYEISYNGHISYYVTNFENHGFVIVAGHKSKGPVLVHSASGSYDPANLPPAFAALMNDYNILIDSAFVKKKRSSEKIEKWNKLEEGRLDNESKSGNSSGTYPDYLLTTEWGQSRTNDGTCPGYNSHPAIPNGNNCSFGTCYKCAAGCVAVAIAQIMNYWEFAEGNWADFEWWNMPYLGLYSTDQNFGQEREAVTYLLKRVGDKVNMDYCSDGCGSGANTHKYAEETFDEFGYDDNSMNYERKFWHTYNQWVNQLQNEIDAGRPVLYRYRGSHTFICDGYNDDNGNFHWNLGWTGNYSNIWVDFEDLRNYDVLINHHCIIGIKPDVNNYHLISETTIHSNMNKTYYAKKVILAAINVDVKSGGECTFIAGDEIELSSGFEVKKGGKFEARVYENKMIE